MGNIRGLFVIDKVKQDEVKQDNRKVVYWLLFYPDEKKTYLENRQAIIDSSPVRIDEVGGIHGQGQNTDSTGNKGAKLADMGRWIDLIEEVEENLSLEAKIFLRLRREYRFAAGQKGWTAAVQWRYAEEVAAKLNKRSEDFWRESRNTFTHWWNWIIEYTMIKAAKKGLL